MVSPQTQYRDYGDDRGETRTQPAAVDDRPHQPLSRERWNRRAYVHDEHARPSHADGAVAAAYHHRAEDRYEVHLPAVLRPDRRQLHSRGVEGRRTGASEMVSEPARQSGSRGSGRHREDEGKG